ncbi:rich repeat and nacht domain-containing protein [Anaeramoeba flamelloides]|uniref:Rich repeat and nacht domain-containing protein n=1 Tax=Anaeramoeba flamelloides TaxID=1746091 RepID=A0ABQ8YZ48_9EUKA|nr:rich repeat and nacht domain-containing protein [Anaeramoeba flamelloides]
MTSEILKQLQTNDPKLTEISNYDFEFSVGSFKKLAGYLPQAKYLETLDLFGVVKGNFEASLTKILLALINNKSVLDLNLGLTSFIRNNETFAALVELITNTKYLEYLHLPECSFETKQLTQLFQALKVNTSLKHIGLNGVSLSSIDESSFLDLIRKNRTLTSFSLGKTHLGHTQLTNVLQVFREQLQVQSLDLTETELTNNHTIIIADLIKESNTFEELAIEGVAVSKNIQLILDAIESSVSFQYLKAALVKINKKQLDQVIRITQNSPNVLGIYLSYPSSCTEKGAQLIKLFKENVIKSKVILLDFATLLESGVGADFEIEGRRCHRSLLEARTATTAEKLVESVKKLKSTKKQIDSLFNWIYKSQIADMGYLSRLLQGELKIPNFFEKTLVKDLKMLMGDHKTKDFVIKVPYLDDENEDEEEEEGEVEYDEILVHSVVLFARSGLFRDWLLNTNEKEYQIKDFSKKTVETLQIFFNFLYCEKLILTADDDPQLVVEEIEDCSDYYQTTNSKILQSEIIKIKKIFSLN